MPATARVVLPSSTTVSRLEPLTLSWSGGSDVFLVVIAFGGQRISCRFLASDGTGTIAPDVLANVTPGPARLAFHTQNKTLVSVPPWDVVVSADNQSRWDDGQAGDFAITVE